LFVCAFGAHRLSAMLFSPHCRAGPCRAHHYFRRCRAENNAKGRKDGHIAFMQDASPEIQRLMADALWHHQSGRVSDAARLYRQILAMRPGTGAALNNLGSALCDLGQPEDAETCFRQLVMLSPHDAEAHNNLGTALHAQQKLDAAEASYRQALAFKPELLSAANNLAAVLSEQARLEEAAIVLRQALAHAPRDSEALSGLAAVTVAMGDPGAALELIGLSLAIQDTAKARRVFIDIVRQLRWTANNPAIRNLLARALTEPWARPRDLARSAASLIKLGVPGVARAVKAWPHSLAGDDLLGPGGAAGLAADRLLMALLVSTQNADIEIERFLTLARRLVLDVAGTEAVSAQDLEFWAALARQCFINEYVFFRTEDEIRAAEKPRSEMAAALETGQTVMPLRVLAVAAYFPLAPVPFAARLLDRRWPEPVEAVLTQQLREPQEEARLSATIPQLTPIDDKVSRAVRAHYEENPYPRWIKPAPVERRSSVAEYLQMNFPLAVFAAADTRMKFLSAGCGTGQLAIECARSLDVTVLAVDLSLASLAYARRKAAELGVAEIGFAQGDILTLGKAGRTFDVIESSGVLHHMTDPFAAWRALLDLLRPGGFMLVGLYSRLARRNIERTRRVIAERGYGTDADAIRQCRQDLLAMPEGENFVTASASDFFGISTCRDLLFHGQETQLDLAEIGAFLTEHGLSLLGFEIGGEVLHAYRQRFPDDPAARTLAHWQAFEADNPETFAGMYIFWVQKLG
jgi:Flp pilus assembly protein TadD/2-polyprenyl-3-methyl-5-hydroxy-6-metoxy-1,4-benzoquinol methylase